MSPVGISLLMLLGMTGFVWLCWRKLARSNWRKNCASSSLSSKWRGNTSSSIRRSVSRVWRA